MYFCYKQCIRCINFEYNVRKAFLGKVYQNFFLEEKTKESPLI